MQLTDTDEQRIVVVLPADDSSSGALDRMEGRHPGALRSVSGRASTYALKIATRFRSAAGPHRGGMVTLR
jgi:hypothetical protein